MRILMDVRPGLAGATGIGRYVRELVSALHTPTTAKEAPVSLLGLDVRVRPSAGPLGPWDLPPGMDRISQRAPRVARRAAWALRAGAPWDVTARRAGMPCELVHATDFVPARTRNVPLVASVHDLFPLTHPAWQPPRLRRRLARALRYLLLRADALIVPTERVARSLPAWGVTDRERVHIIRNGVRAIAPGPAAERDAPYFLMVGTLERRKRHAHVLAAYEGSRAQRAGVELLLVGRAGPEAQRLAPRVRATRGAHWLSDVNETELAALYRGARGLLAMSVDEGFGFPVLEALSCGCPVLVAAGTTSAAVGGEAVLALPAGDVSALREALQELAQSGGEAHARASKGPAHAATFSWAHAARATARVYAGVLGGASGKLRTGAGRSRTPR